MKTNKLLTIAAISFLTLTFSCREEIVSANDPMNENSSILKAGSVKNGRLFFPSKQSLQETYEKLKDAEDKTIANYIDSKNIISLRPILTKDNERHIEKKLKERIAGLRSNRRFLNSQGSALRLANSEQILDDIDDLEEIIGDDAYSAFLDSRAEIQVGNEIYKYTDVGLFIVDEQNYSNLISYLADNAISDDLLYPTDDTVKEQFLESVPSEERTSLSEDVDYFNARKVGVSDTGPVPGTGTGGNTGGGTTAPDANQVMVNFINGLQNCSPHNGLFDGIFGDSDICIDKYESRYRVKTKAYNYNYYLVYNLGVKVKHQHRNGIGIWNQDDAQEVRLGVITSSFYYDYSNVMNVGPPSGRSTSIYSNNTKALFNAGTFWTQSAYYPGIYNMTGYSIQGYPKLFKDDYYIEDILPHMNFSSVNPLLDQGLYAALQAGNKSLSAANLNKLFWTNVVKNVGTFAESLGQPKPNNNITYSYNLPQYGKIMLAKTFYNQRSNDGKIEKSFDWGFQIGFTMDPNGGNVKPDMSGGGLKKPQDFKVLMYGIAKRNGQWHGSKINTGNF